MSVPGKYRYAALFRAVNYAGWPLLAVYAYSMFVHPWLTGDWKYVQDVWDRWQTLNAGAIAFLASLIAFNIAKFNENSQRQREFVAAKAYLPSTLSGLIGYYKQSAQTLLTLWNPPNINGAPAPHAPDLPADYREVFSSCIRHADPAVGTYLSNILVRLQVHEARMKDAVHGTTSGAGSVAGKDTLIAYLLRLGELYILTANLFGFARGEQPFEDKRTTWDDFRSAYSLLGINADSFFVDDSMNLVAFTQRWLKRNSTTASAEAQ